MKEPKLKIKYKIPKEDLNVNFKDIDNKNDIIDKFFNHFENIENNFYNSIILTEIANSKLNINQSNSNFLNSSSLMMHNGIKCERCQKLPIIGHRYKCPKCLNYNLCNDCEQLNSEMLFHPHSNFLLCRDPEGLNIGTGYSFECLDKHHIHVKCGTENFETTIVLVNNGTEKWPINSMLKCRKEESTIFCEDVFLPLLDINLTAKVKLRFKKCNKIPKGEYLCSINFFINKKTIRGPIDINVFIV